LAKLRELLKISPPAANAPVDDLIGKGILKEITG
jgi:hypothetical protein